MLELFGKRQQELLTLILKSQEGLSIDELALKLEITRAAVRQHLTALEADGYVRKGEERKTAGRPGQTYVLTERGHALFPKQYSWFSGILLQAIQHERGSDGLAEWLTGIAGTVARSLEPRLAGKDERQRLDEVVAIMGELAFEAKAVTPVDSPSGWAIEASNCVYHDLAKRFPEVCQFDLELLTRLTGQPLEQSACMVREGKVCRFRPVPASTPTP